MRLHEFAYDAHSYYLVTEYCEGGELLNFIMNLRSFTESLAANIMKQILSAVAYCHARHIVHRDLKPENLCLEAKDISSNIKVVDFGTSIMFQPKEALKGITGTVININA